MSPLDATNASFVVGFIVFVWSQPANAITCVCVRESERERETGSQITVESAVLTAACVQIRAVKKNYILNIC